MWIRVGGLVAWNLSQASQACLCKVFAAGVKFYLDHTFFCCKFVFLVYRAPKSTNPTTKQQGDPTIIYPVKSEP